MASKVYYNTKHLGKGDPLPPFNGKLRVYNMRYCPYAHRTILVLNAKQLDYEVVNIDLKNKPEWFTTKSVFGKVPALEIRNDVSITESLVTSEYLDEAFPQRPLLPRDPVKKALSKVIVESSGTIQQVVSTLIRNPDNVGAELLAAYHNYLDFIQNELKKAGTKFLGGSQPGFADYMIWPWFERVIPISDVHEKAKIDQTKYKLLWEYINNMFKDPAVVPYLVPKEILLKVYEGYLPGNKPDYNLLTGK